MAAPGPLSDHVRASVDGAESLEQLFDGRWPSFHDAEITRIELDRSGPTARLTLRVPWRKQWHNIELLCLGLEDIELSGFNHQNVLAELTLAAGDAGTLAVHLHGIYGLTGFITCQRLRVSPAAEQRP